MCFAIADITCIRSHPAHTRGAVTISRWQNANAGARAYDSAGKLIKDRFGFDGTHYYSFDKDGLVRKGWYVESVLKNGGSAFGNVEMSFLQGAVCILPTENVSRQYICYFDENTGALADGWLKKGNDWLFFDTMGRMKEYGWVMNGGNWYHFNGMPYWGKMLTGWVMDGSSWYYLKPNGAMATGWVKQGGKWYNLQPSGKMSCNTWVKHKGEWYYMLHDGAMAADQWIKSSNSWYYLREDGKLMHSGTLTIGQTPYAFDTNGKWDGK